MMKAQILFIVSLFAAFVAPAFAQESPAAFVTALYGQAGPQGQYQQPLGITVGDSMREAYLSKKLCAALAGMDKRTPKGDAPDLDFDPVSNSNDPSVHDLKIKTETESATQATVVADFRSHRDTARSVLRYLLVQEGGGWKVDDIVSAGKSPWRLSKIARGR
jgi:hypothetical protein